MEIGRQLTWSTTKATMSHYRTKDGTEVDIVLETPAGEVIGIEVKLVAFEVDVAGQDIIKNNVFDEVASIIFFIVILLHAVE